MQSGLDLLDPSEGSLHPAAGTEALADGVFEEPRALQQHRLQLLPLVLVELAGEAADGLCEVLPAVCLRELVDSSLELGSAESL